MINSSTLLTDLRRILRALEADLRARISEQMALSESLEAEWRKARNAGRTGSTYTEWLDDEITQAAVHWILGCVFLRFLEDNHFLERPYLAGADQERLSLARDRHEQYFRLHPSETDREYLISGFREVAQLPGMRGLFDERHNPVFRIGLSGDAAMQLLGFWQRVNPDTGLLIHDFSDPEAATRFLGDLYQELSESARKRYALLQTPVFVEEFILDRTLTPAIDEFGYREVRLIDPTCGSGHFLLGAFQRLFDLWARNEPARNLGDLVQKALNGVYGSDLNPYAVAIARFRLLIAALRACGVLRLKGAPAFRINLAAGDSLLHGRRLNQLDLSREAENLVRSGLVHAYQIEDLDELAGILGRQYHAVVGNPPYIAVKDAALNAAYRSRYASCHMKYSLGVPFTERFFDLAISGDAKQTAGFVGMITANSFMKREFGAKLVEVFLPQMDLNHVVDTSGAHIPGHGTPTIMLFGRNRRPVGDTVRTVMGIAAEKERPSDASMAPVWKAIVAQVDQVGSESEFVSVADTPRATLEKHPWSMSGGGASTIKDLLEQNRPPLSSSIEEIGVLGMTNADEVFIADLGSFKRRGMNSTLIRPLSVGDGVRDWASVSDNHVVFPYESDELVPIVDHPGMHRWFWASRTALGNRATFAKQTYFSEGRPWWEWHQVALRRLRTPLTITFAFVATQNNFALDRGGKVFSRTAPVIKLPVDTDEDCHFGVLGLLNSSTACFWIKQVCMDRGGGGIGGGLATEAWERFYEHDAGKLGRFPVVKLQPVELARRLDSLARELIATLPSTLFAHNVPTRAALNSARDRAVSIRRQMIALQEELDWCCYRLYGLIEKPLEAVKLPEIALGERAFEIVLARSMADGEETTWFARHGSTPTTEVPAHWPDAYRQLVELRIALIESDRNIRLIERPEYKRRWNDTPWREMEQAALRSWLLDRLETPSYWHSDPQLTSVAKLADAVRQDAEFMQVSELYAGRSDFDETTLLAELAESESVPFLPALRYTDSGRRKRTEWEICWEQQRLEDRIDAEVDCKAPARRAALEALVREDPSMVEPDSVAPEWVETKLRIEMSEEKAQRRKVEVGDIAVPPKYKSSDFQSSAFWRLRGGLDVPKERFVSFPNCSRDADGSLVIAWAGWDHLQQATAIASYYLNMKENEGWAPERLKPLLSGIQELVPWLKQWHNVYSPEHATRMGDYFESFVSDEARALGFTIADLRSWTPSATPAASRSRRKKQAMS
jgi:hypothetical protein